MQTEEIRAKSLTSRDKAVAYLDEMIASLKAGKIRLEHGDDSIALHPPDTVTVQLKAKRTEIKESISMKISWRRRPAGDLDSNIRITSDD